MANKIPQSFIDQLLARIDIVEVIDSYVSLKKSGTNHMACCPFHEEKTPSFSVSQRKQFYHCFGCGASGNAITFIMNYDGSGFRDAVAQLAQSAGMEVPLTQSAPHEDNTVLYDVVARAAQFYQNQLKQANHAVQYLKTRGVSGEIAKRYGLGYAPSGWDSLLKQFNANENSALLKTGLIIQKDAKRSYDRFRERVMFPIRDRRGRYIGFGGRVLNNDTPKYLNSPETVIFYKGSELYGLYEAKQQQRQLNSIIIVEGYMDVVMLAQHGVHNAVATLGTATSASHIKTLQRQTQQLYFCFDGDKAGRQAAWRALQICLTVMSDNSNIHFMFLPQGEDPDSFIRQQGKEHFLAAIQQAKPLSDFFFAHLLEDIDISNTQGRAQLQQQAMQHIGSMADNYFKQGLLQELSRITRIEQAPSKAINKATETNNSRKLILPSALRSIITLLLQNPQLAAQCPSDLQQLALPGCELLAELINAFKTTPEASLAIVLERFRDSSIGAELHKLAATPCLIPESGLQQELSDALQRLKNLNIEQKIEGLMAKAATPQGLQIEEKLLLQQLLKAKNSLLAS